MKLENFKVGDLIKIEEDQYFIYRVEDVEKKGLTLQCLENKRWRKLEIFKDNENTNWIKASPEQIAEKIAKKLLG